MNRLASILGKSALVVKRVAIDKSKECQIEIVARKSGLISWLLSLIGIDSTFTFRAYRDRLESEEGSFSGRINTLVPLSALDTFTYGFTKPVILLVFAIAFFVFAITPFSSSGFLGFVLLICSAVFAFLFYLRKSLLLNFTTSGANGIIFVFKRSVIEGVNVDENMAKEVSEIVKENYIAQVAK